MGKNDNGNDKTLQQKRNSILEAMNSVNRDNPSKKKKDNNIVKMSDYRK